MKANLLLGTVRALCRHTPREYSFIFRAFFSGTSEQEISDH